MSSLLLIDAYAMIYRAYYAFIRSPRVNSRGENMSAVFGFVTTLNDLQRRLSPTHIGVAFDPHGKTFRHEAYPDYKAQREETPEDIRRAVPIVKQVLEAMRIPVLEVAGYEADDVIGTLARKAVAGQIESANSTDRGGVNSTTTSSLVSENTAADTVEVYMATPDKDYGQLVGDGVYMYRPRHSGGFEKMGPAEVCEKYGLSRPDQVIDLLGLMGDAADNIPGCRGVGEKTAVQLISQFDSIDGLLSHTDQLRGAIRAKVESQSEQIRFSRYLATICTTVPIELDWASLACQEPDREALYGLYSELEFRSLLPKDMRAEEPAKVAPKAVQKAAPKSDGLQLDLFAEPSEGAEQGAEGVEGAVKSGVEGAEPCAEGVEIVPELVQYMLNPEVPYNAQTPADVGALRANERLYGLYRDVELPLRGVLRKMEEQGVRFDTVRLQEAEQSLTAELHSIEQEIGGLLATDGAINLNSPAQVGALLFDTLQLGSVAGIKPKRTAAGAYSTSDEVLQSLHDAHPVVPMIQDYRALRKLISTYITALPQYIAADGKIHAHYHQTATATGRLSCSDPNLQNLPVRTERGKLIRQAVIPDPDCVFLSVDYSQIELRLLAHFSDDPHLCEAFRNGQDIHAATAAKIFGVPIEAVSRDQRRVAKTANFGIIYGISAFGLSGQLGCSRSEAKSLIDGYFAEFSHVREYIEHQKEMARENGYAETLFGRRRYLPDIVSHNATVRSFAERNAVNSPIQGTAADIIKMAMVQLAAPKDGSLAPLIPIMQVHDELNFSVPKCEIDGVRRRVVDVMEHVVSLRVPLVAEAGVGANWLEAH